MQDLADLTFRDTPVLDDIRAVREMTEGTGFFRPDEVAVAAELVEERLAKGVASGYHFWFAELGGRLAGYVCFGPTPCTIGSYDLYWIVVDKGCQGRGLGLKLASMAEDSIREKGGKRLYVETSGKDQYRSTRQFYKRAGYFEVVILPDFYDVGDSKVIFQKNLA